MLRAISPFAKSELFHDTQWFSRVFPQFFARLRATYLLTPAPSVLDLRPEDTRWLRSLRPVFGSVELVFYEHFNGICMSGRTHSLIPIRKDKR